ncbi:chromosomal replication initiator protein DnaA [Microlunatus sp. GCM10028923]|uniref:chromosomal replication initiator protein DnaA n=1 Tax=Microlunatus sp. GCM10028923 TaxID=3273400 RepID=UPI003612C502
MSEPDRSADESLLAWQQVHAEAEPRLRPWWITSRPFALQQDQFVVAVPNNFTRDQLESRFRDEIESSLRRRFERPIRLGVVVDDTLETAPPLDLEPPDSDRLDDDLDAGPQRDRDPLDPSGLDRDQLDRDRLDDEQPQREGTFSYPEPAPERPQLAGLHSYDGDGRSSGEGRGRLDSNSRLNPKYSFETFVIGGSNRFAHAAAVAVAENPGKSYNPLTIYGESGLGKTHLLHALGHYVRNYFDRVRVRYVSTEELTNDFINAISQNKGAEFRRRYRDVDVLLIDDIQFLEGKEQTQEEFFHTFNTLHNAQKQIVMTSDRPPKLLENLEPRLRSRFGWGLITDVQPPDLETRIAILRKKAAQERLTAGSDVLEFIASKIQTNIRELEGALIRVTAFASLNRQQVDMALAEVVLKDLIPEGGEAQITSGTIMGQTAAYFGLTIDDLCGQSRTHALVTARQIAMYLCRELTDLSLPKIGQQFGGRDHTTVMHADRKVRNLMAERRSIFNQVTELTNRIKNQSQR